MLIRAATLHDVPALARLSAAAFSAKFAHLYPAEVHAAFVAETYDEGSIRGLVEDRAVRTWVIDDGGLLAYAMLCAPGLPHPEAVSGIELKRFYTAPDVTGRGLGGRLMDAVVIPAAEAAAGDAWLGVYSDNAGAQRFYARYGFVRVGEYEFPVGPMRDREFIMRRVKAGARGH